MEVQTQEDDLVHLNNMVIKRRRTKRQRPSSPLALTMATSSSSTVELAMDGHVANSSSSPSDSGTDHEFVKSTEEEEDMANCLILLAQGHNNQKFSPSPECSFLSGYQCKTCNRCFPSFQALGGHRASHKKPKPNTILEDIKKPMDLQEVENCLNLNKDVTTLSLQIPSRVSSFCPNGNNNTTLSLQIPSRVSSSGPNSNNNIGKNKNRVHECSICGAEFSSGQALGGHMRRHRPLPTSIAIASNSHEESHETKNSTRNFLSLDLNLPAPEDDHRETKFSFASKEQVIVFSASPLVDCHY